MAWAGETRGKIHGKSWENIGKDPVNGGFPWEKIIELLCFKWVAESR